MHFAAGRGQTKIALALIKAGADINAKEKEGLTALHFAAELGQTKIALALIKAGRILTQKINMAGRLCIGQHGKVILKLPLLLSKQGQTGISVIMKVKLHCRLP